METDNGLSLMVDIDSIMEKLEAMKEDDYATVKINVSSDGYNCEMTLSAINIEDDREVSYGTIDGISEDFY